MGALAQLMDPWMDEVDGGGRKVRAQRTYLDNLLPILDFLFPRLHPRTMAFFFFAIFSFSTEPQWMTLLGERQVPLLLSRWCSLPVRLYSTIDACNSNRHHHHDDGISFRCFTIRAPGSSALNEDAIWTRPRLDWS